MPVFIDSVRSDSAKGDSRPRLAISGILSLVSSAALSMSLPLLLAVPSSTQTPEASEPTAGTQALAQENDASTVVVQRPAATLGPSLRATGLRGLRPAVIQLLLTGEPGGELAMAALAVPTAETLDQGDSNPTAPNSVVADANAPAAKPRRKVLIWIEIDGASFLEHNQAAKTRVEAYVYALDAAGGVAGHSAATFGVDITELGERIWQSGFKIESELELEPGTYRLRTLVLNSAARAFGLREVGLVVPNGAPEQPDSLSLLYPGPEQRDSWIPVSSIPIRGAPGPDRRSPGNPSFFSVGKGVSTPEALPVLISGGKAKVILYGALGNLDLLSAKIELVGGPSESVAKAGRRKDQAGEIVKTEVVAEIVRQDAGLTGTSGGTSGSPTWELRFVPPDLPPGMYVSRARIETRSSETQARPAATNATSLPAQNETAGAIGPPFLLTRETPVLLVDKGTRERDLLWPDVRSMLASPRASGSDSDSPLRIAPARAARDARIAQGSDREVRQLAQAYQEVLGPLATASSSAIPEAAVNRLFELESETLGTSTPEALRRLLTAELQAAKEIQKRQAEAMLPVIELHFEMVERYRSRRLYSLVYHARRIVELLAERYAEAGGSPGQAAQFLAAQAGNLQKGRLVASSRRLFHRALAHDPESPSALLGLAASYEAYGQYNEAVEMLTRLVESHPTVDQARLRLAINQQRLGRSDRARDLLSGLVELDRRDWVCVVAHQELARNALARGDDAAAVELLEKSVQRLPSWNELRTLLAYAYDRLGRSRSSLEQLQRIDPTQRAGAPTARWTYDQWPDSLLAQDRDQLTAAAGAARPLLAKALRANGVDLGEEDAP